MGQFLRNMKGGITVMVTLLLLPSLLLTGAGVDVARIYSASSVMQNANQLTANALLTQYDGLLQDLYGIYAIDDTLLTSMVDEYIESYFNPSVYTQDGVQGLGTFQLFYGTAETTITPNQTLIQGEDASVLRRQIEEYAKYSVPIQLYPRLLELLDTVAQLAQDISLVRGKVNLDQDSIELLAEYNALYQVLLETQVEVESLKTRHLAATELEEYLLDYDREVSSFSSVERYVDDILTQAEDIDEEELAPPVSDAIDEYKDQVWEAIEEAWEEYEEAASSLLGALLGVEPVDEEAIWEDLLPTLIDDLTHTTQGVVPLYLQWLEEEYSVVFDALEASSAALPVELYVRKIAVFDTLLAQGQYSEALVQGITTSPGSGALSAVSAYESLTIYDAVGATNGYVSGNGPITDPVVTYGESSTSGQALDGFLYNQFDTQVGQKFQYDALATTINSGLSQMENRYDSYFGVEGINPAGALYHTSLQPVSNPSPTWSIDTLPTMVQGVEIAAIGDDFTDRLLTLGYGTYMFSNYSSVQGDTALSGLAFDTDMNYFYQSELEYILLGYDNAIANVAGAMQQIFALRMTANYCGGYALLGSAFVEMTNGYGLSDIYGYLGQSALLGLYATGQSAVDMEAMLAGQQVATYHTSFDTWTFRPIVTGTSTRAGVEAGLATVDVSTFVPTTTDPSTDTTTDLGEQEDMELTMGYWDYLNVLLVQMDEDTLASRIIELISCNLTNVVYGLEGDETQMAAIERYDVGNYVTGIQIDTTAQVEMLFLSMGNFQNLSSGFSPVSTKTILVSDMRGY